jgi:nicotinamide-nucleotide amidase
MSELLDALPDRIEHAARDVLERACALDVSIVTAESCTGGLLASLLTDVEGASHAFERGFVVYTDEAKAELLGIAPALIAQDGAVSRATAIAMAQGALARSRGDVAVSVTGFAGPGAPGDEPGLVHFACARRDGPTTHREEHFGDVGRGAVRLACLDVSLALLREAITGD